MKFDTIKLLDTTGGETFNGLEYLSSSGLPKTFLKIILATYLSSEASTALACTGLVVKSIAGI